MPREAPGRRDVLAGRLLAWTTGASQPMAPAKSGGAPTWRVRISESIVAAR